MIKLCDRAFTLIELLVVITIIAVLLALLTPALDSAIHQAELAGDGARFKALANVTVVYAAEYKRYYFYRHNRNYDTRPNIIAIHDDPVVDDRVLLAQYMSLDDVLVDPFVGDLKLGPEDNTNNPIIYMPTNLFAGFRYDNERGLYKIGDRMTYTENFSDDASASPSGVVTHRFNVLASDIDWGFQDGRHIGASHPDDRGILILELLQNELPNKATPAIPAINQYHTAGSWSAFTNERGGVDLHYAYDDGAVQRLDGVQRFDERTRPVGLTRSTDYQFSNWIPAAN